MPSNKRGVYQVISPRELITGKKLRVPACDIGEYVMGHQKTTNDTGTSRCVEGLYLDPSDNGTGYLIFKLDTKQPVLMKKLRSLPMPEAVIEGVNKPWEEEE